MRVQITCEKCGGVMMDGKGYLDAEHLARRFTSDQCGILECPQCTKLTYGPLTEEMVAGAIVAVADKWMGGIPNGSPGSMQKWLATAEARFVLRLLNHMFGRWNGWGGPHDLSPEYDWTAELLEMARQK